MMDVGSPSLQNLSRARHTEQMFNPGGRSPSVDTVLSLGVPAGDDKGASMLPPGTGPFPSVPNMPAPLPNTMDSYTTTLPDTLVSNEALPMSSSTQITGIETLAMSSPGTVDGVRTTFTSLPDNGLSPSVPSAAYWTTSLMPQNPNFESSLLNMESAKEFNEGGARDVDNQNLVIPPTTAPLDTEETRVDVDDHRLDMATQPSYLGESQPSQADTDMYSSGETQLVHDNQEVEFDEMQPPFAGETQPINGDASFDDVVVLQNNTLTASATPITNAEPIQGKDSWPSQDSFDDPTFSSRGNISSNGIPASCPTNILTVEGEIHATTEGPNERVSITEVPTVNKQPEIHPVEIAGQLNLTTGKEEKDIPTSELQPGILNVDGKSKADEVMSQDGVAEIDIKDDAIGNTKVVSEQDIQAIKGRKVVKKFGRKNFEGEVVDYDSENQWFKVVYEDGDQEDLELLEVKEILLNTDASSSAPTAKRKRSRPKGAVDDQQARKQKGTPKKKGSGAGARKKSPEGKSKAGSKTKGLKRKMASKVTTFSAHETPVQSQPASGTKRKRRSDSQVMTSSKQSDIAKTPRKRSAKQGRGNAKAKNSARKKGTRHRSLSKLPNEAEIALAAREGNGRKPMGKRRKTDASKDEATLVGKAVKKDFGGSLYSGVVAKFDKKTNYYKVKYDDGDQEDLELEELKAVLVQ